MNAGEADLRAHDPELRSGTGERRRVPIEAQSQADAVQARFQLDLLDRAAFLSRRSRRLTPSRPGFSSTFSTLPAETPLYSSVVFRASTPEPSAKSIVISGPRLYNSR